MNQLEIETKLKEKFSPIHIDLVDKSYTHTADEHIETKKTPDVHSKLTNEKLDEKWKEITSQVMSKHESIRD